MCDDLPYRPSKSCLVYSFGILDDFSFDDDSATYYGCNVFSFDPGWGPSHRRSSMVTFLKLGVGGQEGDVNRAAWKPWPAPKNDTWRLESFTDIKHLLGHEMRTIDIVKMDIEGAEWTTIADMAKAGELSTIKQLLVEFHLWNWEDVDVVRNNLNVLAELSRAGYRLFYSHMYKTVDLMKDVYPVLRTLAYEVSFVNTRYRPPS